MSRQARIVDSAGGRRADLAAIHVAKKALGWDDDTYRDILWTVCQVRSSGDLDFAGRKRLLAHLSACQAQMAPQAQPKPARPAKAAWLPQHRLMWSRWQQLADAGLVESRAGSALESWVYRQTGVNKLVWLNDKQRDLVLASLKRWLERREEPTRAA